jgi:hypothetical protein
MARSQVADGGDCTPDIEGNCEYIEEAVADSRQGVVLQLGVESGTHKSSKRNSLLRNVVQGLELL